MIKKYMNGFSVIFLVVSNSLFLGQVGINNITPQQALHVSGSGTGVAQPLIRIDGLNATNNTAHESVSSVKRVFATSDGDLVILNNNQTNKYYTSAPFSTTPIPAGTERAVSTYSFTLDYPSLVHIDSRIGFSVTNDIQNDPDATIRNGKARIFGTYYKFTAAPAGVATNVAFGQHTQSHATRPATNQLFGLFYLFPRKDLYLPKGSYTLVLYGFSGDSILNLSVNSIGQSNQTMRVSITPVTY